jgi:endonuclease YncB( thermonuclease family)
LITVFLVEKAGTQPLRLHLTCSPWGESVRRLLLQEGYTVSPTDQPSYPEYRDEAELARVDALLDELGA